MSCISLVPDSTPFWDGRTYVDVPVDRTRRDVTRTRTRRDLSAIRRRSSGYKMRRGYVEKGVAMIWYMKWGNFQKIVS